MKKKEKENIYIIEFVGVKEEAVHRTEIFMRLRKLLA